MATGAVPMLTRGAFATYFGGPDLLDQLDERSGSIVRYHVKNLALASTKWLSIKYFLVLWWWQYHFYINFLSMFLRSWKLIHFIQTSNSIQVYRTKYKKPLQSMAPTPPPLNECYWIKGPLEFPFLLDSCLALFYALFYALFQDLY